MFANSQNFKIHNSHIVNIESHSAGSTGIDVLLEASAPEAAYDSSARDPPPRCFPRTREEFVEDIIEWAFPPVGAQPQPVYWMKGPAGVGKSAVAQSCVERLKSFGAHSPAFFFSINGWNKHQKFFPSIAYQLSTIYPDYHDLIDKKIRRNRTLVNKTLETQFWGLLVEPLQELEERGKGIGKRIPIFVDGLDECGSQDAQCEIVEIVTNAARDGATPLCWAFFSRPLPHIEATFSKTNISSLCHKAILPISRNSDGDIELYLRSSFENILRRLNLSETFSWPSHHDLRELVHAAGGLFIYAKTIIRFIGQPDSLNPDRLLRMIISMISHQDQYSRITGSIFAELDAFYTLVMQRIPSKIFPVVHRLLAVLCWGGYSSAIMIANFLGLSRVELEVACGHLAAVVCFQQQQEFELIPAGDARRLFPQSDSELAVEAFYAIIDSVGGSISFYHKSFQDFLLNPRRSGIYCIKPIDDSPDIREQATQTLHYSWQDWCAVPFIPQPFDLLTLVSLALARAPDAPGSVSEGSYPPENELVSSLIEIWVSTSTENGLALSGIDFDFCNHLYIFTSIAGAAPASHGLLEVMLYQCAGLYKHAHNTLLCWFQGSEFANFDTVMFKGYVEDIKLRQQNTVVLSVPSLFDQPRDGVEFGLYAMGCGLKLIFWYWEINYSLEAYREIWTLDLVEGEMIYREQWCNL